MGTYAGRNYIREFRPATPNHVRRFRNEFRHAHVHAHEAYVYMYIYLYVQPILSTQRELRPLQIPNNNTIAF